MTLARLIEAVEIGTFLMDVLPPEHEATAYEAFSGSLDAAKRLHDALLPGWFPGLSQNVHNGQWLAWVQTKRDQHFAATWDDPARAWLLAILRAMEGRG